MAQTVYKYYLEGDLGYTMCIIGDNDFRTGKFNLYNMYEFSANNLDNLYKTCIKRQLVLLSESIYAY